MWSRSAPAAEERKRAAVEPCTRSSFAWEYDFCVIVCDLVEALSVLQMMSEGLDTYQSGGNRHNPQPLFRPQSIEPTRATRWGLKARVLCTAVVCGLGTGAIASQSCPSRLPEGPSIIRTGASHCMLTSLGVLVNLSGRHSRSKRNLCECIHGSWRHAMRLLLWGGQRTRCQTAGRPGRKTNSGHKTRPMAWPRSVRRLRLRLGRGQFDECAYSLSEIDPRFQLASFMRQSTETL